MPRLRFARSGPTLLIAGAVTDSMSGLFTRLIAADGFTTASGRGLVAFCFLLLLLVWRDGRGTWRSLTGIGIGGLLFVGLNGAGMVMNILSLSQTSVANFFMIFATAPFVAAIGARVVLGERMDVATLLAAIAGFVGITIMMVSGASTGGLVGDIIALGCVLIYCAIILVIRRWPGTDILPSITLTVLLSGVLALPFADFTTLSAGDAGVLILFGVVQLGIGNLLIFSAASRIPAAQSGLLGILNAAFAPFWVFLFLGEVPSTSTLFGGAIILAAAVAHLVWAISLAGRARRTDGAEAAAD